MPFFSMIHTSFFKTNFFFLNQLHQTLCNLVVSRLVEQSICVTEVIWVLVPSSLEDSRIDINGMMEENTFTYISQSNWLYHSLEDSLIELHMLLGILGGIKEGGGTSSEEVNLSLTLLEMSSLKVNITYFFISM